MSQPIRVGIMGCASIAQRMVIPAILQSPGLKLVAIASRSLDKAVGHTEKFGGDPLQGYEALLNRDDLDAVYIPLPTGQHHHWAKRALESGKHVLIEKSLATHFAEAEDIVQSARKANLLVKENFMFVYHRQFSLIKNIVASGRLGELRCVRSSFGFPPFADKENIRYQKELGGGALLDAGAYTIKVAHMLRPNTLNVVGSSLHVDPDFGVDIQGGILMEYDDGCVAESAFGFDHFYQCTLELWGSKGRLTAGRIFTAGPGVTPRITVEDANGSEVIDVEEDNHFLNLLNDFSATIGSGNYEAAYSEILTQARTLDEVRRASHPSISARA